MRNRLTGDRGWPKATHLVSDAAGVWSWAERGALVGGGAGKLPWGCAGDRAHAWVPGVGVCWGGGCGAHVRAPAGVGVLRARGSGSRRVSGVGEPARLCARVRTQGCVRAALCRL